MASRSQHDASSAIHAADERRLPLLGVKIEVLQRYAFEDARFTDDTMTEMACQHIFKADGMPEGWTDLVSPVPGTVNSSHKFRNDATGAVQDAPPQARAPSRRC